jgi:hypothetical protein
MSFPVMRKVHDDKRRVHPASGQDSHVLSLRIEEKKTLSQEIYKMPVVYKPLDKEKKERKKKPRLQIMLATPGPTTPWKQ